MEKFNNKIVAERILNSLNEQGAELGNASINIIDSVLKESFKSEETFELTDCSWGHTQPLTTIKHHLEAASSHGYTNSKHASCPQDLNEAIEKFSKKFEGIKQYAEYWDNQSEIITKVTTIEEVIVVVSPEDKK